MGSAKAFSNATLNTLSVFHPLQWWLRLPLNDLIGTDGGWSETQTSEVISHSPSLSNQHWYCFWKVKCVISLPLVAPSGIVMFFLIGQTGSDITTLNVFRIAHDYLCNIKYVYCVLCAWNTIQMQYIQQNALTVRINATAVHLIWSSISTEMNEPEEKTSILTLSILSWLIERTVKC